MGSFLFKILVSMMILPFLNIFVYGVTIPEDLIYKLFILIGFAFVVVLHEMILDFLTVPKRFITRVLSIGILASGFLYLSDMVIPGFQLNSMKINSMDLSFIKIEEMELSNYVTMVILAILTGITYYLVMKLKSK